MARPDVNAPFNPWTATVDQARRAVDACAPGTPDPLAQYHAAQDVAKARESCLAVAGGCDVLRCLALCAANRLILPGWLADAFTQRHSRVTGAELGTWDAAFGSPWPKGARLDEMRRSKKLQQLVHTAVWALALQEPATPINRALFDRVGSANGIHLSGSSVERIYYQAIGGGAVNVALVRNASPQLAPGLVRIDSLLHSAAS